MTENKQKSREDEKKIREINNPLWVSVSEAAKIGGVQNKTIRRAIQSNFVKFKIVGDRYQINLESLLKYCYSSTKLKNKIKQKGMGQYIEEWNKILNIN